MKNTLLAFVATYLLSGCTIGTSNSETNGFYQLETSITLRNGRTVELKGFELDRSNQAIVENLADFKMLDPAILSSRKDLETVKRARLTDAEVFSLYDYTTGSYILFKSYFDPVILITGDWAKSIEARLLATISALNKLPRHSGTVYFGACLPLNLTSVALKKGQIFVQDNFTSASTDQSVAEKFSKCKDTEKNKDHAEFLFTIDNSSSGAGISEFSHFADEKEVLFLPAQPFRVKNISKRNPSNSQEPSLSLFEVVLVDY